MKKMWVILLITALAVSCASMGGSADWDDEVRTPGAAASAEILLPPRGADGEFLITENFDRFAVGTNLVRGNVPGSFFEVTSDPQGGTGELVIVDDGGSRALKMTHNGPIERGQTRFFYRPSPEVARHVGSTRKVEIECRFKVEGTWGTASVPYVWYGSEPQQASLTIGYNSANGVFMVHNSGNRQDYRDEFAMGEWHHLRAVMDYSNATYDLYMNGEEFIMGGFFRHDVSVKDLGHIRFYLAQVTADNYVSLYLDDIVIRAGF